MKIKLLVCLVVLSLLLSLGDGVAADTNAAAGELKALVSRIQTKMRDGKKTEADLAPELKEFDALLAKHKGEKTDDVAQILFMKAMLYEQVLKDTAKGDALMEQLQQDFPDSKPAKTDAKQQEEAKKVRSRPGGGSQVPRLRRERHWRASRFPSPTTRARWCCWTSGRPGAGRASANCPT